MTEEQSLYKGQRIDYPLEQDIDLDESITTRIAIYDADMHSIPHYLYNRCKKDPYKTLEKLYTAQYTQEDGKIIDYVPKDKNWIVGLRFRLTFKSDTGYVRIPHAGDIIESILFDDNEEHNLYLGEWERKVGSNEYLNLPIMYKDDYYIHKFYGTITVVYIAHLQIDLDQAIDNYFNGGSTQKERFLA
jgi:hypothetical protein